MEKNEEFINPTERRGLLENFENNRSNRYRKWFKDLLQKVPVLDSATNNKNRWKNIYGGMVIIFLFSIFASTVMGSMFINYIFLIFGKQNVWVGYLSGAVGVTLIISFIPIGFLIDTCNRATLARIGASLLFFSLLVGSYSILFDFKHGLFLYNSTAAIGAELYLSSAIALFTDSLTISERVTYFTYFGILASVSSAIAPLISIIYFSFPSNSQWSIESLRVFIVIGLLGVGPFLTFMNFFLKNIDPNLVLDLDLNDRELENLKHIENPNNINNSQVMTHNADEYTEDTPYIEHEEITQLNYMVINTAEERYFSTHKRHERFIPWFLLFGHLVKGVGLGFSSSYLILYLTNVYNIKPNDLNLLNFVQAILRIILMQAARYIMKPIGRAGTILLFRTLSLLCMIGVCYFTHINILLTLLAVNPGFIMGTSALESSLSADFIRSKNRGKWNAASTLFQIVSLLTEFFGGYIADAYDYKLNFIFASIFFATSSILTIPVIFFSYHRDIKKN